MSIDWAVVPLVPQVQHWLQEEGVNPLTSESRYPTLNEILVVLESFGNLPVTKDNFLDHHWTLTLGTLGSSPYACMLGEVEDDGLFHFHFYGSGCQEELMMRILKRLAASRGPLVLYESIAATPIIVSQSINIEEALEEWDKRIKQKYAGSGLIDKGSA